MPSTLKTPGVFIEENNLLAVTVSQVATAIPAFVGYTEKIPSLVDGAIPPVRIKSMLEYEQVFGGPDKRILVKLQDSDPPLSTNDEVASVDKYGINHILWYCMQLYFENGGGPCYISSAGVYPAMGSTQISITHLQPALDRLEPEDEPTLLIMPEVVYTSNISNWGTVATAILAQCAKLQDRFAILDTHTKDSYTHTQEIQNLRDNIGLLNLKYGAAYYPRLNTLQSYQFEAEDNSKIWVQLSGGVHKTVAQALIDGNILTGFDAVIRAAIIDPALGLSAIRMALPPSSAVAAAYVTTDNTHGVWKAPAHVIIRNVTSPSMLLTNAEQEDLNVHSTGKSVNAIRSFTGKGITIWGARTLDGNSNEWRYVPVRRLFNTIEESLKEAVEAMVFEPNDANTWMGIRNMTENFLNSLWKQGALAGATPAEAYFVKVGLGQTMLQQDILDGNLIVEAGVAAVRPAEFIVLRITHKLQES